MSVVRTYCGHGIGDLFHCAPNVPHYAKNKAKGTMKVGEIFTIGAPTGQHSWQCSVRGTQPWQNRTGWQCVGHHTGRAWAVPWQCSCRQELRGLGPMLASIRQLGWS